MPESQPRPRAEDYLPLTDFERRMLQRLFGNPGEIPPEFWAAVSSKMEITGPRLLAESISGIKGEEWREVGAAGQPAFANSWVNFDAANYQTAAFYKAPTGIVYLKGLIKSGTLDAVAFTLPEGYRPPKFCHFACLGNAKLGGIRIAGTTGAGTPGQVIPGTPGDNTWMSLEGIAFRAA